METVDEQQKTAPGVPFTKDDPRINREGRPVETEEQKLARKAKKEAVREIKEKYLEGLAYALPEIEPALIEQARKGNVQAIKEIHDRIFGKSPESIDITSKGETLFRSGALEIKEPNANPHTEQETAIGTQIAQ